MAEFSLDLPISFTNPTGPLAEVLAHLANHMRAEGFKIAAEPTLEKVRGGLVLRVAVVTDNTLATPGTDIRRKVLDHFGIASV